VNEAVVMVGLVCVAAAVVGGGIKLAGGQFPVISSVPRQVLLGAVGVATIVLGATADNGDTPAATSATTSSITTPPATTRSPGSKSGAATSSTTTTTAATTSRRAIEYLAELESVPGYQAYTFRTGQAKLGGDIFTRSILLDPWGETPGYVEYDLSRDFATFEATLGLQDDVPAETVMQLEVFGDGNVLFRQSVQLGEVVTVSVGVANLLRLRLQATDLGANYPPDVYAVFGDARLTAAT
jgi:hypothetical protein